MKTVVVRNQILVAAFTTVSGEGICKRNAEDVIGKRLAGFLVQYTIKRQG